MKLVFNKLVGLLSMIGTVAGLVGGGATVTWNVFVGGAFFLLAFVSFILFAAFLYNFIRYAQYEMPVENVIDKAGDEEP